uniref:Uncharacterized protein n=1 Tax=Tetraselmis chuii TaxID=63592 RepID=A0A7S1T4P1_9CHLO
MLLIFIDQTSNHKQTVLTASDSIVTHFSKSIFENGVSMIFNCYSTQYISLKLNARGWNRMAFRAARAATAAHVQGRIHITPPRSQGTFALHNFTKYRKCGRMLHNMSEAASDNSCPTPTEFATLHLHEDLHTPICIPRHNTWLAALT